jgi:diguanylate cyclase (GGDEF)-like protein/PAS domain S-box-containing protein
MGGDEGHDPVWAIADLRRQIICRYSPDLRLLWIDDAYARLYGRGVVGTSFLELLPPSDRDAFLRNLQRITPAEPRVTSRHRSIRPDGTIEWQEWTDHGVYDSEGNILEYHAVGRDITEEVQHREGRVVAEARLNSAIAAAGLGIWEHDLRTGKDFLDERARQIMGFAGVANEAVPAWLTRVHPDDHDHLAASWAEVRASGTGWNMQYRARTASGSWVWVHSIAIDRTDDKILGILSDVTERRKTEERLRGSERRLQFALHAAREGLWDLDLAGGRMELSDRAAALLGLETDPPSDGWLGMVHEEDQASVKAVIAALVEGRDHEYSIEHRIRRSDRSILWVHNRASALDRSATGRAVRLVGLLGDVTDRRRAMLEFEYLAHHDALTGLLNRTAFWEVVGRVLGEKRSAALVLIDLDHFKPVNDDHGHDVGDQLLIEVAARLRRTVRRSDTAARLGGDEFALLCPDYQVGRDDGIVQRVLAVLAEPYWIREHHVIEVSASAGIAPACPADSSDRLYTRADGALYAAKRAGRNRCVTAEGPA